MKTQNVSVTRKTGMQWIGALVVCLGMAVANAVAGYAFYSVQGNYGPSSDSGTVYNLPGGAWMSIEAVANSGTASVYVNGGGVSRSGTVYGSGVISEAAQTSYTGDLYCSVYANGGSSYSFVEISW